MERAEILGIAAAEGARRGAEQGQADAGDHKGRDNRRDESAPGAHRQAEQTLKEASGQDSPGYCAIAVICRDNGKGDDKGKTRPHENGEARPQLPHGCCLQQGGDSGRDHGALDKPEDFRLAQHRDCSGSDDAKRDHIRDKHGQKLLEGIGQNRAQTGIAFQGIERTDVFLPVHGRSSFPDNE